MLVNIIATFASIARRDYIVKNPAFDAGSNPKPRAEEL
jgi:hypothetical protein